MANHKSATKKHILDGKRRARNRWHRSRLRTEIKKLRAAVAQGDSEVASGMLTATLALVDRSAKHGVMHRNAADRTKSRLTRAVQGIAS